MDDERRAVAPRLTRGRDTALAAVTAYARDAAAGRGAVVLVEGLSDQAAVEALAARRGRDLRAEGVRPPGGPPAAGASAPGPAPGDFLDRLGFFVCVADLEDELIRSLGTARVEQVVEAQGELGPLRTFSKQPFQRERTREQQLRRFMGTRSGRKIQYARALAEALDPARIPEPLDRLLARV